MSEDDLWTTVAMCESKHILITDLTHYVYCKNKDSITSVNESTLFRADNHMAVAEDLYDYMSKNTVEKDTEIWLCCKILYIAQIAINIYVNCNYKNFHLSLEMFQNLFKRLSLSRDKYAKQVGLLFYMRIINQIKELIRTG